MPKTLGLSYSNELGKTYHGIAADNHFIYDRCGGLPAYTLAIMGGTSLILMAGCKIYQKLKEHRQKPICKNNDSLPETSAPQTSRTHQQ